MQLKKYVVSLLAVALSTAAFALPSPLPLPDQADTNKAVEEYLAQLAQVQEQANAFNQVVLPALKGIAQEVGNKNLDDLTEAQQEKVLEYVGQLENKLDEEVEAAIKNTTEEQLYQLVVDSHIQPYQQAFIAHQITAYQYEEARKNVDLIMKAYPVVYEQQFLAGEISEAEYKAIEAKFNEKKFPKQCYKDIQEVALVTQLLAGYVATDALSEAELSSVAKVFYPDQEREAVQIILQQAKQLKEQNEQLEDLFSKMGIFDEEQK